MCLRPIANKYHEGKMKRTLERELKVPELAEREANGTSDSWQDCCKLCGCSGEFNFCGALLFETDVCSVSCLESLRRFFDEASPWLLKYGCGCIDATGMNSFWDRSFGACSNRLSYVRCCSVCSFFSLRTILLQAPCLDSAFVCKDADKIVPSDPSWNTDQGV